MPPKVRKIYFQPRFTVQTKISNVRVEKGHFGDKKCLKNLPFMHFFQEVVEGRAPAR